MLDVTRSRHARAPLCARAYARRTNERGNRVSYCPYMGLCRDMRAAQCATCATPYLHGVPRNELNRRRAVCTRDQSNGIRPLPLDI
jgi:hypothetical protein